MTAMSSHNRTQEAVQTDGSCEGLSVMEEHLTDRQEVSDGPRGLCQATIDDLPDDVLLEIFEFYLDGEDPNEPSRVDKWHPLVHVCGRWRSLVFASPRRLDLRLLCTGDRSVRAMLDIWPALPIQIEYYYIWRAWEIVLNNIIVALEHPDRVRHISIKAFPGAWEALIGAVSFPELTVLRLKSTWTPVSVLPSGFAPRLRTLELECIPFPVVRDLLLSAGDLVDLTFSGSVSSELLVACLSSLKRLESLSLGIPGSPDQPHPHPQARVVLPALAKFSFFEGKSKYLEDFVARIDTPVLSRLYMSVSIVRGLVFDISHLRQFIGRARGLEPFRAATLSYNSHYNSWIILLDSEFPPRVSTLIIARMDWEISSIALVCGQLSPLFSLVERLDLRVRTSPYAYDPPGEILIESIPFLELFRSCTTIQGLYVTQSLLQPVATALQGLTGERATEVLPNLRDLFLGGSVIPGSVQEAIQPFVDA